ncbi:MAG: biotin/lipoyl-binding protein [Gomphosphaeria aponina SAG 52.96 = DSM 107014]|uniref:Biotin/lipoyl-binding protein n=1 Tax=Gomphosphaeria aponina SAG 52.96 = DSM 107014 TaxID=1521640 RepID=A0A941GTC4_9CHRO|nr:biotin/lipoyl-binding protein [Gomphosphaeria aponina SAG 52.96 = DSM 107014]
MFSQSNALNTAQTKKQEAINILPVETIKVTPVDTYEEYRTYTGTIVASRISELGFDRPGKIIKILVEEGDKVKAGEPLATLDTANLKAEQQQLLAQKAQLMAQLGEMEAGPRPETIAAARATVKELEEQLELARLKSKRREELYAQGAISREQLDEATFATTGLLARLEEAKSNFAEVLAGTRSEQIEAQKALIAQTDAGLANLQIELEKTILKAPFSGTISARKLDEGSVLSGAGVGQPVLRLVEDGLMEGRIGLPVAATAQIEIDSYQQLKIGEKIYPAQVKAILPELDNQTRTLTVVYTLPGWATEQVYPGQVAQLRLTETIPTAGYWLPTTALVRGVRGLWSCYVLAEKAELEYVPTDGENVFQIEQRYIEVLYTKNDQVLVRGTLQPGDQVILNGTHRLVPQQLVQPVEQKQLIIP